MLFFKNISMSQYNIHKKTSERSWRIQTHHFIFTVFTTLWMELFLDEVWMSWVCVWQFISILENVIRITDRIHDEMSFAQNRNICARDQCANLKCKSWNWKNTLQLKSIVQESLESIKPPRYYLHASRDFSSKYLHYTNEEYKRASS